VREDPGSPQLLRYKMEGYYHEIHLHAVLDNFLGMMNCYGAISSVMGSMGSQADPSEEFNKVALDTFGDPSSYIVSFDFKLAYEKKMFVRQHHEFLMHCSHNNRMEDRVQGDRAASTAEAEKIKLKRRRSRQALAFESLPERKGEYLDEKEDIKKYNECLDLGFRGNVTKSNDDEAITVIDDEGNEFLIFRTAPANQSLVVGTSDGTTFHPSPMKGKNYEKNKKETARKKQRSFIDRLMKSPTNTADESLVAAQDYKIASRKEKMIDEIHSGLQDEDSILSVPSDLGELGETRLLTNTIKDTKDLKKSIAERDDRDIPQNPENGAKSTDDDIDGNTTWNYTNTGSSSLIVSLFCVIAFDFIL
jgi:hypothetical protein